MSMVTHDLLKCIWCAHYIIIQQVNFISDSVIAIIQNYANQGVGFSHDFVVVVVIFFPFYNEKWD